MANFEPAIFNLLFNAILSFLAALGIVLAALAVSRARTPAIRTYLLSLPFLKIIVDLAQGIPDGSYVRSHLNFFALPSHLKGFLAISTGFDFAGPVMGLRLGISQAEQGSSTMVSVSAFDLLYTWIADHHGTLPLLLLVSVCAALSGSLVIRRVSAALIFEYERRRQRPHDRTLRSLRDHRRTIDVYSSTFYAGTPFSGGVLRPYICIPDATKAELDDDELEAVIAHELAHVRHFDVVQSLAVRMLGDIFWFVPFYRIALRRLEMARELLADSVAARAPGARAALASALLKLQQLRLAPNAPAHCSGLLRSKSTLRERIETLLSEEPRETTRNSCRALWAIGLILVTVAVYSATFGTNYRISGVAPASEQQTQ